MHRRRQSPFEDFVEFASKMPWWTGVLLALISYVILHNFAAIKVTGFTKPGEMGTFVVKRFWVTMAFFGQLFFPAAFTIGALISVIKNWQRRTLLSRATGNPSSSINDMSWTQFEMLVGEAFRRKGYSVTETGGGGADEGVDLVLKKQNETFLVQCKQWRAYKVGVKVVRELYGVMAAKDAAGGYVVTSGRFTDDAKEFASGKNIELLDGLALGAMINSAKSATPVATPSPSEINCPQCGSKMIKRRGLKSGSEMWGCSNFPKCRGTLPV